jgi:hypothetical protein
MEKKEMTSSPALPSDYLPIKIGTGAGRTTLSLPSWKRFLLQEVRRLREVDVIVRNLLTIHPEI